MSFGSQSGRTRSGTKGSSSNQKKLKRKKQEFHTHRAGHLQESERLNPEEVRARTIIALDRLGHQILSNEPGGYDLEHWMRSLTSLLDDFQEKLGSEKVSDEFRARRQAALLSLAPRPVPDDVVAEIEKHTKEEAAAMEAIAELERKAASTLASLREEREACAKDLRLEKKKLAEVREAKQTRQFFSRLLKAGPSTEQAEKSVADLEQKLSKLEEDIDRLRKVRSASEGNPAYVDALRKLDEARARLAELQSARQNSVQLTQEREIATKAISEAIASMKLNGEASSEGGMQEE